MTMTEGPELGYWINDADNHFNEPPDCFERYIDPEARRPGHPLRDRRRRRADAALRRQAVEVPLEPGDLLRRRSSTKMLGDTSNIGTGRGTVPAGRGRARTRRRSRACCSTA